MILEGRLTFGEHLKIVASKIKKTIGLLSKLQNLLPTSSTTYLSVRPPLEYCDIIYDKAYKTAFHRKLEIFQCNACLVMTGTVRGASKEKLTNNLLIILDIEVKFLKINHNF